MRDNNDPTLNTVICTPDTRKRALAFVGRVCHVGFVITPDVELLTKEFSFAMLWALHVYKLDIEHDTAAGGWRVVRWSPTD